MQICPYTLFPRGTRLLIGDTHTILEYAWYGIRCNQHEHLHSTSVTARNAFLLGAAHPTFAPENFGQLLTVQFASRTCGFCGL